MNKYEIMEQKLKKVLEGWVPYFKYREFYGTLLDMIGNYSMAKAGFNVPVKEAKRKFINDLNWGYPDKFTNLQIAEILDIIEEAGI